MSAVLNQQMSIWEDEQDEFWNAVVARDSQFDGHFVFSVQSTKIYCRPSCPARRARRDRVSFFALPEAAEQAGFRACLRCHPKQATLVDPHVELIQRACRLIEAQEEGTMIWIRSVSTWVSAHFICSAPSKASWASRPASTLRLAAPIASKQKFEKESQSRTRCMTPDTGQAAGCMSARVQSWE